MSRKLKLMVTVAALLSPVFLSTVSIANDETIDKKSNTRGIAGAQDFSRDYLEQIKDEHAMDIARRERDRLEHDKYLNRIARDR